jgi:hypothetical protein
MVMAVTTRAKLSTMVPISVRSRSPIKVLLSIDLSSLRASSDDGAAP